MSKVIDMFFEVLAVLFDKVPFLNKLQGYRSVLGFVGLAVVSLLSAKGIGDASTLDALKIGFAAFTTLALNSKGR